MRTTARRTNTMGKAILKKSKVRPQLQRHHMSSANTLCWTDIPVTNFERALKFYSAVLGREVPNMSEGGVEYGLLPHEEQNASGCLCVGSDSAGSENKPSQNGPLIYLSVEGRLDDAIKAARANGGKVLQGKHPTG